MGTVAPFKIIHMIVAFISIFVVYFLIIIHVLNKCLSNKPMNFIRHRFTITAQRNMKISCTIYRRFNLFIFYTPLPTCNPKYATTVGHFINPFKTNNRLDVHHIDSHNVPNSSVHYKGFHERAQARTHYLSGIAGIQDVAPTTRRPAKPQHDFVYRVAGAARRGENRAEKPARITRRGRRTPCSGPSVHRLLAGTEQGPTQWLKPAGSLVILDSLQRMPENLTEQAIQLAFFLFNRFQLQPFLREGHIGCLNQVVQLAAGFY